MNLKGKIINNKYKIINKIGEGGISFVFLSQDLLSNNKIALKILKPSIISNRVEDLSRFKNEAHLILNINCENIIKIFEVGEDHHLNYIAMEYIKGKSLKKILADHYTGKIVLSFDDCFDLILKITESIANIHQYGIIHRDLKPGNIMIITPDLYKKNPQKINKYLVKIIDFGLSYLKEYPVIHNEDEISGTFCYMSPEQCGIIKGRIDERSDLYSAGIIFYQLLTKVLPFSGKNLSTIIHQHAAVTPQSLCKNHRYIPAVLDKIILKLLEKEPQKRYQSVKGLLADLKKIKQGRLNFELGQEDGHINLNYQTYMIGREEELKKLKNCFNQTFKFKGGICLINGVSGIGKTRLVNEFKKYVEMNGGVFIDGKCFAGNFTTPYSPFKEALDCYIKQFNQYPEKKKLIIQNAIKKSIGSLGEVILKINPLFKQIIGECLPLVELEAEQENRRFLIRISHFFSELSKIEKSLVLFIDDIHWLDQDSFVLLNEIFKAISQSSLLIIGSYRTAEIKGNPIKNLINPAKRNNYLLHKMTLKPFKQNQIENFIADLLFDFSGKQDQRECAVKITEIIFKKSNGHPFFIMEILKQMIENKVIIYNQKWIINDQFIEKIEIPVTMIDMVLKRISLLNQNEIKVLSYAAIIGKKFTINLLFALCKNWVTTIQADIELIKIVDKAVELQLLETIINDKGAVLFAHDRIRNVFYKNINHQQRKKLHLDIANELTAIINKSNDPYLLFDLVNHYIEANDPENVLKYLLPVVNKSRENYAYDNAIRYLKTGLGFIKKNQEKYYHHSIKFNEILGEIYLTIGKNNQAIKIYNELLLITMHRYEKARLYKNLCIAYFKKGMYQESEKYGFAGLKMMGVDFYVRYKHPVFFIMKELITHYLSLLLFKKNLRQSKKNIAEKHKIISSFLLPLGQIYYTHNTLRYIYLVLFNLNLSFLNIGKSREIGLSIIGFAALLVVLGFTRLSLKYFIAALKIRKSINDKWGIAQTIQLAGFYYLFTGNFIKSILYFKRSYRLFTDIGDIWEIAMCLNGLFNMYCLISDYQNQEKTLLEFLSISKMIKNKYFLVKHKVLSVLKYIETGEYEEAENWLKKSFVSLKKNKIVFLDCLVNAYAGYCYLEQNKINLAITYLVKAADINNENNFLMFYTSLIYPYLADAYIEKFKTDYHSFTRQKKAAELRKIKKACFNALNKTRLCISYHLLSLRVTAKYYMLVNQYKTAQQYFKQCIQLCEKYGRKYELAKTFYEYGIFFDNQTDKATAANFWMNAYEIFKQIGANAYIQRLEELLNLKKERISIKKLLDRERLSCVIEISQDLCSIINITDLLNLIMKKAIVITGAQRGYLFIRNQETDELELKAPQDILISELPSYSSHIINEVFEKGKFIITTNAEKEERYAGYKSIIYYGLKSILCIPMMFRKKITGVCYLDNPALSAVFTEEDADILTIFMAQAAIAIENANLYHKEKLQQQKLYQIDKLVTLGTIVSCVGHEINNPINTIMANANLFTESYAYLKPVLEEYYQNNGDFHIGRNRYSEIKDNLDNLLTGIVNGAKRIKHIAEDLNRFSRKNPDQDFETIEINRVVESAVSLLANIIKNSTENFSIRYAMDLPLIKGKFQKLEQALVNIIQNACHALQTKNDAITISTYLASDQQSKPGDACQKIVIEIIDTGKGMDQETLKHIVSPFFTTKYKTGGIGLGLYIVENILKEHNGRLEFLSEVNKGTTVKMIILSKVL